MNYRARFPVALAALVLAPCFAPEPVCARVEFSGEFAPSEGRVAPQERPLRDEVCLNGAWQFQAAPVPPGFRRGGGTPPDLPAPREDGWDATPIRIPSPWNVNTWGGGRDTGAGTARPYWPDSVWYPDYPAAWDGAEMGWLRRTFRVPAGWTGRRLMLHFEAVAGGAQVLVNGRPAGSHFEAYLPFDLDVTDLVRHDGDNEVLVGIRARSLFDRQSERYPKMRAPYPCGSSTERLAGIWQDVFILGLPPVRVDDVFVQPQVDRDTLIVEARIRNDDAVARTVSVGGDVHPWVNLAGTNVLDAPEPRWKLGPAALSLPAATASLAAGAATTLVLRVATGGRLAPWTPDTPNLHAAVLTLAQDGAVVDRRVERFGWRQFTLVGREVLLNGRPIRMTGDFLHPFSPAILSRRHVWAWYRLIKDFGGNAIRPHAQPHPRHYLDLADEMGLVVLDETAIFGSSIALNFEDPAAWPRFEEHYDALVRRDRNHPSVLGWSFGNELFAIFDHNNVPKDVADDWYRRFVALGMRARGLDPTRAWISCDGDEDLRGALPVWSKHFGHGTPLDRVPDAKKPCMVGESGGTYYARPKQMAEFNGARAYESYAGRNEALAIDVYDNIVHLARPRLAWYSASETAWFGVEHLGLGWGDRARLPDRTDGIFFTRPPVDGRPGMQPARMPPFVGTLNPGWDPSQPLYKPLAMFDAQKAALAPAGPQPCVWDRRPSAATPRPAAAEPAIDRVGFAGDTNGPVARRLRALGVPLSAGAPATGLTVVDAATLRDEAARARAKELLEAVRAGGGTALVLAGEAPAPAGLLPADLRLTDRPATALAPDPAHPWTASFTLPDLYFAEEGESRFIQRRGLDGPILDGARVLLRAGDTDWSLFNNAPEFAKCSAVVLHEQLVKPSGAALVERVHGAGRLVVCSLDPRAASRPAAAFWRRLFANAGVRLGVQAETVTPAFDDEGVLVNALAAGRFGEDSIEAALAGTPVAAGAAGWRTVTCPSRDRFVVEQMGLAGPESGPFAVDFAFWLRSPRALDDLLAGGPDAPRFTIFCYASEGLRLFLDGRELKPAATEPADYRTRLTFENVPLKKDWNRIAIRLASQHLRGATPATLAVRIRSNNEDYLKQVESAVDPGRAAAP